VTKCEGHHLIPKIKTKGWNTVETPNLFDNQKIQRLKIHRKVTASAFWDKEGGPYSSSHASGHDNQ
jgi:hypothetical protein